MVFAGFMAVGSDPQRRFTDDRQGKLSGQATPAIGSAPTYDHATARWARRAAGFKSFQL